jgi:hypothetical protein
LFVRIAFGLLVFALVSCEQKPETVAALYNVDSLLTAQANWLSSIKTSTKKVAILEGRESSSTLQRLDTTGWKSELEIFGDLDLINKPINRNAYQVEQNIPDTRSNLLIKLITTQEELPIRSLKIYYHQTLQKIKRIEAQYLETNTLYSSSRLMTLEFHEIDEKTTLAAYSVSGGQKMFMGDSVQFSIRGNVTVLY